MTKMLSVKTAERRHVPAATSIQIYSISPPTVVYLLALSFLYNNHYSFFLSKIEKENKITRNNFFFFSFEIDRAKKSRVEKMIWNLSVERGATRYRLVFVARKECRRGSRVVGLWKWMRFYARRRHVPRYRLPLSSNLLSGCSLRPVIYPPPISTSASRTRLEILPRLRLGLVQGAAGGDLLSTFFEKQRERGNTW